MPGHDGTSRRLSHLCRPLTFDRVKVGRTKWLPGQRNIFSFLGTINQISGNQKFSVIFSSVFIITRGCWSITIAFAGTNMSITHKNLIITQENEKTMCNFPATSSFYFLPLPTFPPFSMPWWLPQKLLHVDPCQTTYNMLLFLHFKYMSNFDLF